MKRRIVKLAGAETDLDDLPHWFPYGECLAFRKPDGVYIASADFLPSHGASEVRDLATEILSKWYPAVALLWPNFVLPNIEYIIEEAEDGTRMRRNPIQFSLK